MDLKHVQKKTTRMVETYRFYAVGHGVAGAGVYNSGFPTASLGSSAAGAALSEHLLLLYAGRGVPAYYQ